jgi:hypothetical protein
MEYVAALVAGARGIVFPKIALLSGGDADADMSVPSELVGAGGCAG